MHKSKNIRPVLSGLLLLVAWFSLTIFVSCEENIADLTLGEEFIESQTNLNLVDTFSVDLSTIILDTLTTSGTGSMLVGNYEDDIFGPISSSSYFQIGIPSSYDMEEHDIYDSLKLVLTYSGFSYGDTTINQKLYVHQLTEKIEIAEDEENLNSNSSFEYNSTALGSVTYTPQPNSGPDTLAINLSNETGAALFDLLMSDADLIETNVRFIDYFKGLVLVPDPTNIGSVIGFNGSESTCKLLLYTTRPAEVNEHYITEFPLEDEDVQFNQIQHDFSSTVLNGLSKQSEEMPSNSSDDKTFLLGGLGLTTRIDFPSIDEIMLIDRSKILKVEMELYPLYNSTYDYSLPTSLYIYQVDGNNEVVSSQGILATSSLTQDDQYHENTYYSFDLTTYITDELSDNYIDPDYGLYLTLPSVYLSATFKRVILDGKNLKTKLKIYYISY